MENTYTYSPLDRVIWDTPAADAILNEVDRLSAKKVYIVASSTLSKKSLFRAEAEIIEST